MALLTALGLISLALAALSGWLVLAITERPQWFRERGIPQPARFRQLHLDWVFMGLLLIAVQVAAPQMPDWIRGLIAFGAIVNPLLFVPLAWGPAVKSNPLFVGVTLTSFLSLSVGLPALAIWAIA
ncbi:MAG: hypothetical protein LT070_10570 [Solirubrobacteraceae bacterium]|nr:hypothetical protein [Solirubrobacteraceae bacterium]